MTLARDACGNADRQLSSPSVPNTTVGLVTGLESSDWNREGEGPRSAPLKKGAQAQKRTRRDIYAIVPVKRVFTKNFRKPVRFATARNQLKRLEPRRKVTLRRPLSSRKGPTVSMASCQ